MPPPEDAEQETPDRLSDVLVLERRGAANRCQWLRGKMSAPADASRQIAVAIVADTAVRWQCRGAVQHYDAWREAITTGTQLTPDASRRLVPFIRPTFGLPDAPPPPEHLQGHVAECVWYILAKENVPADLTLRAIEGPSFMVTTPGGRTRRLPAPRRCPHLPLVGDQKAPQHRWRLPHRVARPAAA